MEVNTNVNVDKEIRNAVKRLSDSALQLFMYLMTWSEEDRKTNSNPPFYSKFCFEIGISGDFFKILVAELENKGYLINKRGQYYFKYHDLIPAKLVEIY